MKCQALFSLQIIPILEYRCYKFTVMDTKKGKETLFFDLTVLTYYFDVKHISMYETEAHEILTKHVNVNLGGELVTHRQKLLYIKRNLLNVTDFCCTTILFKAVRLGERDLEDHN